MATYVVGIEGLPGCGKTTIIKLLVLLLCVMGLRVVVVDIDSAPGAKEIRQKADAWAKLHGFNSQERMKLMWQLRRLQHEYAESLKGPGLDLIILDRSYATSIAMDCYGSGQRPEAFEAYFRGLPCIPELMAFIDVPPEVALLRKNSPTMRDKASAERIYRGYQYLATQPSWVRIEGNTAHELVTARVFLAVLEGLAKHKKAG